MGIQFKETAKGGAQIVDDSAGATGAGGMAVTKPVVMADLAAGVRIRSAILNTIARTDTANKTLGVLPAGAVPYSLVVSHNVSSNAGTTATISIGTSTTSNFFLNNFDVRGATGAQQARPSAGLKLGTVVDASNDTPIVGSYTDTGLSTVGGPWVVELGYYIP